MSLKLNSTGGGSITLQEPNTASNRTLTLPDNTGNLISSADSGTVSQAMLASGVAGNGPAFSAYLSANQNISSGTTTKIQINTKEFDTDNCFNNTTNYRFTPNVAGYYQVNALARLASGSFNDAIIMLHKNGVEAKRSSGLTSTASAIWCSLSTLVYMNGTSDYVEIYGYIGSLSGTPFFTGGASTTFFQATLARAV